ncbi:tRNA (guanine-N(7)-)-methyltransferase non-catalytic subunit wuho [Anopheles ziemanni]|uniref:tRNA (guanine-N(7)-)-methyltransferase non-catalytic subunit wuho n=1 Tax=Anopheles coustani TaxID=139045 RepID=UPI00265995B1|nr:tRNA (guanine-N(7)-)-methyltransferase non-catalytic subunit wuho [Anopheles coustani]XP_058174109.1 tRNA (guanine-N(7)-)-methyltransferase non-catalytic subunit wuho [Anopheles ziemanni]
MHDLKIYPTFTAVGIKDRVVLLSNNGERLHEIVISPNIPAEPAKSKDGQNGNEPQQPAHVVTLEYCLVSEVLAVSLNDKTLQSYRLKENEGELLSEPLGDRIQATRTIVCMKFAPKHGVLFGCDKSDCFEFDPYGKAEKQPKWIMGHMSQILDMAVSEDERYIITCDRDEKIKVTSYPDCHNIVGYCLGHHEYVGGLELLSQQTLLSLSGDKTLRLWNYTEGKEITCHNLDDPAVGVALQPLKDTSGALCAVRSLVANKIEIAHIQLDDSEKKCVPCETLSLDAGLAIVQAALNPSLELVVLAIDKESKAVKFLVYTFDATKRCFAECTDHVLQKKLQNHFEGSKIEQLREYSTLFKNTIDNLSDYFERKKLKIDGKKSK